MIASLLEEPASIFPAASRMAGPMSGLSLAASPFVALLSFSNGRDARHEDVSPTTIRSTQQVFPVYHEQRDNLVGVVSIKDVCAHLANGAGVRFKHSKQ